MKLKLDLHTHCQEAFMLQPPTIHLIGEIIAAVKAKGLAGIGVTEHGNRHYGQKVKEIVETYYGGEILVIPGHEIDVGAVQIVELFLPNNSVFRFLAHPGYPADLRIDKGLHGIELENSLHNHHIDKELVRRLADKHDLLLLCNSDAHQLESIGQAYNEISLDELYARATPLQLSTQQSVQQMREMLKTIAASRRRTRGR